MKELLFSNDGEYRGDVLEVVINKLFKNVPFDNFRSPFQVLLQVWIGSCVL